MNNKNNLGILSMAELLVKAKCNINIYSPKYGTPLSLAVERNHK